MPDLVTLNLSGEAKPEQPSRPLLVGTKARPRLLAMITDNVIAIVCGAVVASQVPILDSPARGCLLIVTYLSYYFFPEALWAKTPMKAAFHLKVRRLDGGVVGWGESAVRTLARIVEVNPLLLGALPGALAVAFSARRQRLGDMLARTVVVSES